jgi:hypothetical protein
LRLVGLAEIDQRLVWSSTAAPRALRFTDSMPLSALALRSSHSLQATTWPLGATEDGANRCRVEK